MLRLASFAAMVATPTKLRGTRDREQPLDLPEDARSFPGSAGFRRKEAAGYLNRKQRLESPPEARISCNLVLIACGRTTHAGPRSMHDQRDMARPSSQQLMQKLT